MKHIYARDIMVCLEQVSGMVKHLRQLKKTDGYLFSMIKYVIEKSEILDRNAFHQWVQLHLSPPSETNTMASLAAQWMAEGTLIGERRLLTTLLNRRFSHLIQHYRDKINQADEKTLQLWGEKILDAKEINEVFSE